MIHNFVVEPFILIKDTDVIVEAYVSNACDTEQEKFIEAINADMLENNDDEIGFSLQVDLSKLLDLYIDIHKNFSKGRMDPENKPSFDLIKMKLQKLIMKIDALEYQEELT